MKEIFCSNPCETTCKECENNTKCKLGKEILNGVTNNKDDMHIPATAKEACDEAIRKINARESLKAIPVEIDQFPADEKMHKFASTKEKLMYIMSDTTVVTFEGIVFRYISEFGEDFPLTRLNLFSSSLNEIMLSKTQNYENALRLSRERARYVSRYLSGKMYEDEESMKKNMHIHAGHVESIIQYIDKAFGKTSSKDKE